ncbi:MAG: DUF177 domain-containing protein [bacterium]|nr:DUF177 domain-containing protein [bacterium]
MSDDNISPLHGELGVDETPIKWSLNLKDLLSEGITGKKCSDRAELQALTDMLNDEHDLEVTSLICTYDVRPSTISADKDVGRCLIDGCLGHFELKAKLRQTCVITLERIDTLVEEKFTQSFSSKGGHRPSLMPDSEEIEDLFAQEPPLKLIKGKVELGPLVYQYLSLAIDANPRKQGAQFDGEPADGNEASEKRPSPFVVLENFKHKK